MKTEFEEGFQPQEMKFGMEMSAEAMKASARSFLTWFKRAKDGGVDVSRFLQLEVFASQVVGTEIREEEYQGDLAKKIEDTSLPSQLKKILELEQILFLGDFQKYSEASLMKIPGVKHSRVDKIRECLRSYGLPPLSPE